MRNILIITALLLILFTVSCQSSLIVDTVATIAAPETVIVKETVTVEDTAKIAELQKQLNDSQSETKQYRGLIANLNDLLKNVYYVYGEGGGTFVYGTGFSIEYKDKFYLITAGHIVDGEWGIHKNLRFKANFTDNWVYPKLLNYKVTETIPDYAIYYSDKIDDGLNIDFEDDSSQIILGNTNKNLNIIRENSNTGIDGECGSPVVDLEGEVTGIFVGYISPITNIIQIIDTMK